MRKKSIDDVDFHDKRALVRVDFNVPLDEQRQVTDDRRIREALPTIRKIIEGRGRAVLMSHLGRPIGAPDDRLRFSLAPAATRLGELLGQRVLLAPDCIGPETAKHVAGLKSGAVYLLENLRFHEEETIADRKAAADPNLRARKEQFAGQLAELGDIYVNDAFGTCHRDNASMLATPRLMVGKPRVVGKLVQKELKYLGSAVREPKRPSVVVLGGAKVSDKLALIEALLAKFDHILIGGAMAYTFLAATGISVGKSKVEADLIEKSGALFSAAAGKIVLPLDHMVSAKTPSPQGDCACVSIIPSDMAGYDIGPQTTAAYTSILLKAKTIVWNGPMGMFEVPPFDRGTVEIARAMAAATDLGAVTIVGGGDSASAVAHAGLDARMSHISTGGGAALEYLQGKTFAAIDVLDEAP